MHPGFEVAVCHVPYIPILKQQYAHAAVMSNQHAHAIAMQQPCPCWLVLVATKNLILLTTRCYWLLHMAAGCYWLLLLVLRRLVESLKNF
jgi:hypothetical protein